MTPKSRGEKSHSGIPGSKAACAYPGRIVACRALLQLSSRAILQTAWHVGPYGGIYWRLVKLTHICARVVAYAWCHLEYRWSAAQFTSSLRIKSGAELHLFERISYLQDCLRSCFGKYKAYVRCNKGFERYFVRESFYLLTDLVVARRLDSSAR